MIPWLEPSTLAFPAVETALEHPNGLLAAGGALTPEWLLLAYRSGIFPWYDNEQPILWWSPDPRSVLVPDQLHVSRSLEKALRQNRFTITMDEDFDSVISACAAPRKESGETWITNEMQSAYRRLHELGHVHSVECWRDANLVGGLYGVAIGRVFFGESMFSLQPNASKLAFVHLVYQLQQWGFQLIDCQQDTPHLRSLGAKNIARRHFLSILGRECDDLNTTGKWQLEWHYR